MASVRLRALLFSLALVHGVSVSVARAITPASASVGCGTLAARQALDEQSATRELNAALAAKYTRPELNWIMRDPDAFVAEIRRRFGNQKVLTPKTPYQFDYSEFGMPLVRDMRDQLESKIAELLKIREKAPKGRPSTPEIDTTLEYLRDLQKEVATPVSSGAITYQQLYELSGFFSRAIGHFDARTQSLVEKAYLLSDRLLTGYDQLPIAKEYAMYKDRKFSLFQKKSPVPSFRKAEIEFEKAFYDPDELKLILVPTNASLDRDIFMRLMAHDIYFAGVTDTPIRADGILRPGGDFWNHDLRHSTVMFAKRQAYLRRHRIGPTQLQALKVQMDRWQLQMQAELDALPDADLREAVIFLSFNNHHERGFPFVPSMYKRKQPTPTPYLLYGMMETNQQKTNFKVGKIRAAHDWLKKFWDARSAEEARMLRWGSP